MKRSAPMTAIREPGRTVDDSVVQSTLSESFSRTVKDWERVRQSRSKSRSVSSSTSAAVQPASIAARKPSSTPPAADYGSKSRDREKSRQRAEKELSKLAKKEQKLQEEMQRLVAARSKLEAQLESSSASDRGGESGSRGEASADDEQLLAALDLLENVDDQPLVAFSDRLQRGRSKSTRMRRQSCMLPSSTSTGGVQRATSVGDSGRVKADRKSLTAAGPRSGTAGTTAESDSDSRRDPPTKSSPTSVNRIMSVLSFHCITIVTGRPQHFFQSRALFPKKVDDLFCLFLF